MIFALPPAAFILNFQQITFNLNHAQGKISFDVSFLLTYQH